MAQIIPGILEHTIDHLQEKLSRLDGLVDEVHIDLVDEQFAQIARQKNVDAKPNLTLDEIEKANVSIAYSLHLMTIFKNISDIKNYCLSGAQGLVVYYDAYFDTREMLDTIKTYNKQVALALEPETEIYEIEPYLDLVDYVLVMGYQSGKAEQIFIPAVLDKIEQLHHLLPDLIIGVDGGIEVGVANQAVKAGANFLVVNSAIFGKPDTKAAIDVLLTDTLS